ncbi:MAG TPA: hypothetical protein VH560_05805 [Polyangia bacterium]|jgi:hypothetical protein|nr:hypothetical protein [Polyangia bacterium]
MKSASTWALGALAIGVFTFTFGCGGGHQKAQDAGTSDATPTNDDGRAGDAAPLKDAARGDASDGDAGCAPACAANQTCVLGACQATPAQMAAMPGCGAAHLVVGGGTLYWTERATGAVKSLATTSPGGAPTLVASGQSMPGVLAVDDTNVYWANDGDKSLEKAPVAGGAPVPLPATPDLVSGVVANGGTLYYGAGASTYKLAPGGTTPTTLMSFASCKASHTGAIALDADYLYQTDYINLFLSRERNDGTQSVTSPCSTDAAVPPQIAAPTTISHSQGELFQGALDVVDGELVWADNSNLYGKPVDGTTSTGAPTLATTANAGVVTGFIVRGSNIYIGESGVNEGTGDTIEVAPLDPGDAGTGIATIIATTSGTVSDLATDATHVYWVVTSSAPDGGAAACAIMSLAQ